MAAKDMNTKKTFPGDKWLLFGGITLAVVFLVYAAFDDITTDNATSFTMEYICLLICSGWCLVVAVRLIMKNHRILGIFSLLALAAGVWGQRAIGPGIVPGFWPEYVATLGSVVWFFGLSIILMFLGKRAGRLVTT